MYLYKNINESGVCFNMDTKPFFMNKIAENIKKADSFFTVRNKIIASVICGAAAVLWMILWNMFPMEFYSLFFASAFGSNIMLLLLILVLLIPFNLMFSKLIKADISMNFTFIKDIPCMLAVAYTFSIFRYTQVWWFILALIVHIIADFFITGNAYEGKDVILPLYKRKPLFTAAFSFIHIAVMDSIMLLLMFVIAKIFSA